MDCLASDDKKTSELVQLLMEDWIVILAECVKPDSLWNLKVVFSQIVPCRVWKVVSNIVPRARQTECFRFCKLSEGIRGRTLPLSLASALAKPSRKVVCCVSWGLRSKLDPLCRTLRSCSKT